MSDFSVIVKRILAIEEHPNANAIEIAVIDGYRSIIRKNILRVGGMIAYIPEASILPDWLLKDLGFWDDTKGKGTLNGAAGNRVKAVKLRGVFSEGICYPITPLLRVENADVIVQEGEDVTKLLGITKWEPPIPVCLSGEVFNAG